MRKCKGGRGRVGGRRNRRGKDKGIREDLREGKGRKGRQESGGEGKGREG